VGIYPHHRRVDRLLTTPKNIDSIKDVNRVDWSWTETGLRLGGRMPRERLAEVLHRVDPKLRIVEARPWLGKKRTKMNRADWEKAAGISCSNCGREVFRSRDGLCIECWEKANEFEIRDKAGVLEFLPESVIMEIVHLTKKESQKVIS